MEDNLFLEGAQEDREAGRLLFQKPIIEEGDQIAFKVYLLQKKGIQSTEIEALGKISGMDQISVIRFDPTRGVEEKPGRSLGETIGIGLIAGYVGLFALGVTLALVIIAIERREGRTKKKRGREFIEANRDMTDEQKFIVESYGEGWPSYYLRTIRTLAGGGKALDISALIQLVARPRRSPLFPLFQLDHSYRRLRRMLPLRWDPAVFDVTNGTIALNTTNRELVLRFLRHCGELVIEPTGDVQPATRPGSTSE